MRNEYKVGYRSEERTHDVIVFGPGRSKSAVPSLGDEALRAGGNENDVCADYFDSGASRSKIVANETSNALPLCS